jgi:predicted phosphodiesterase
VEPTLLKPASRSLAFLSDVHGNLPALDAVLSELGRRAITDIFIAGDLLLGGDAPLDVWRRVQQVKARCTRGPSDVALANVDPAQLHPETAEEREAADRFIRTREELGELVLMQLRRLPASLRVPMIDGRELVMVHGSPSDPYQGIGHELDDEEIRALVGTDPADIFVCGATHVPFDRMVDDIRVINVGSVGERPGLRIADFTIVHPKVSGADVEQHWMEY